MRIGSKNIQNHRLWGFGTAGDPKISDNRKKYIRTLKYSVWGICKKIRAKLVIINFWPNLQNIQMSKNTGYMNFCAKHAKRYFEKQSLLP